MERLNEEQKKTLRAIVWDMDTTQLRIAILYIINGADIIYSIDTANYSKRETSNTQS